MAFDAYMPVMLAVMEVPGCLVALYLVARLRHKGMDAAATCPTSPVTSAGAGPVRARCGRPTTSRPATRHRKRRGPAQPLDFSLDRHGRAEVDEAGEKPPLLSRQLLHEVFLNPGLFLLFGGIIIGLVSQLQGDKVAQDDDIFFSQPSRARSACSCWRWA